MVPVVVALTTHSRSRTLKGTRTMLTLWASSLKLSGYMRWWVVLLPTSTSNPAVGALFILGEGREDMCRITRSPTPGASCDLRPAPSFHQFPRLSKGDSYHTAHKIRCSFFSFMVSSELTVTTTDDLLSASTAVAKQHISLNCMMPCTAGMSPSGKPECTGSVPGHRATKWQP